MNGGFEFDDFIVDLWFSGRVDVEIELCDFVVIRELK